MESKNQKPSQWRDYDGLATLYNRLEKGRAMEAMPVTNITLFKQALSRRGVVPNRDFQAYTKKGRTYLKRLSDVFMKEA